MKITHWLSASLMLAALPAAAQEADPPQPLLEGYGNGGFAITAANPEAQAYFDNAMALAHAFAHQKAINAARRAVELDPSCAMCLWADAFTSGPTINYTISDEAVAENLAKVREARRLAQANGTELERDLIDALEHRYINGGGGSEGDLHYAYALQHLSAKYPDNAVILSLTGAALLDVPRDDYGDLPAVAEKSLPYLELALGYDPDNTAAIHYYIHASEMAQKPQLSIAAADRLGGIAPNASHLVHMPSHVFYWTGRYQDAADVNLAAVKIGIREAEALGMEPNDGVWGLPYHVHNVVFGLGGALMADDAETALELGRPLVERSRDDEKANVYRQTVAGAGYFAVSRFASLEETMAMGEPKLPFLKALYHYARGEALARAGDIDGVRQELAAIPDEPIIEDAGGRDAIANQTVEIANLVLTGRIAMMEARYSDALETFLAAAAIQESVPFSYAADPPLWWFPVRRETAAAKLALGDAEGATAEAVLALAIRPLDPVALALSGNVKD